MTNRFCNRLSTCFISTTLAVLSMPTFRIPAMFTSAAQAASPVLAAIPRTPDQTIECELLVIGGGLAGTATAYESLKAGRTVCMTDLTDWIGGQISSQGTSALDEAKRQRELLFYASGYKELRQRIERKYGQLNPGECWVSVSCFLPQRRP